MGDRRSVYRSLERRPEEKDDLKDIGIDGGIILKWIFKEWNGWAWA
jgi:hypothetical protein